MATYVEGDYPVPEYRLLRFIGRGGAGEVWEAASPHGAKVALKIIGFEGRPSISELAPLHPVRKLQHPNIVPLFTFWVKNEQGLLEDPFRDSSEPISPALAETRLDELVIATGLAGENLHDRLSDCQRGGNEGIPAAELLTYMEDVARGIDYLNQIADQRPAVPHCCIKPHNILLMDGSAAISDAGLARLPGDFRTSSPLRSIVYMAPEMLATNEPAPATDQYSLAITYVELRTGSLPFATPTIGGILLAQRQGKLDLSKLGKEEQPVIRRATAVNPADRFLTATEMVSELRRVVADQGKPAAAPAKPPPAEKPAPVAPKPSPIVEKPPPPLQIRNPKSEIRNVEEAAPTPQPAIVAVVAEEAEPITVPARRVKSDRPRFWLAAIIFALLATGLITLLAVLALYL